jgi:hypothetical protein
VEEADRRCCVRRVEIYVKTITAEKTWAISVVLVMPNVNSTQEASYDS